MSSDDQHADISPRVQALARLTASVLAGLVVYVVVTLSLPGVGWEIATESSPFLPPAADGMYFNEMSGVLVFLVVYMVLSFWAAMD